MEGSYCQSSVGKSICSVRSIIINALFAMCLLKAIDANCFIHQQIFFFIPDTF